MTYDFLLHSFIAGILASLACGLGALPLFFKRFDIQNRLGLAYGLAGGLMFSAAVCNLILPGLTLGGQTPKQILLILVGLLAGAGFLWSVGRFLTQERLETSALSRFGSKKELLIFIAMSFHSIPKGMAVGVGFASAQHVPGVENLGIYIALAIAIHNIPEGLAVAFLSGQEALPSSNALSPPPSPAFPNPLPPCLPPSWSGFSNPSWSPSWALPQVL